MKKLFTVLLISALIFIIRSTSYAQDYSEFDFSEISSEAETTTINNKDPIVTPDDSFYLGDVNFDKMITAADARRVLMFCSKMTLLSERQCVIADMNSDKAVNATDARLVLRTAAKLEKINKCQNAEAASEQIFLSQYDERKFYEPYLKGFSTNIKNEEAFTQIKKLEDYCAKLGNVATFYFADTDGDYYIQYNSDKVYRTQCTIKAPYIKSMLEYMEKNKIPLSKVLYLKSNQKWNGHYLASFKTGTGFTIEELMYYAIRHSDNTAYQMLFDYFGPDVLNNNAKKVGSSLRLSNYMFGETSASDMAKLYLDIYNYKGKYKDIFFTNLKNSRTSPLISNGIPAGVEILRKSGSGGNATVGYHDSVVVLTDDPYVLVIYTSINTDRGFDRTSFKRIGEMTYAINSIMK